MQEMIKIPLSANQKVVLKAIPGHFITPNAHVNYYLDLTTMKSRLSEASAVAKELSKQLNVTRKTIQYWSTPACHKRFEESKKKNMKIAIKLNTKGDDLDG